MNFKEKMIQAILVNISEEDKQEVGQEIVKELLNQIIQNNKVTAKVAGEFQRYLNGIYK